MSAERWREDGEEARTGCEPRVGDHTTDRPNGLIGRCSACAGGVGGVGGERMMADDGGCVNRCWEVRFVPVRATLTGQGKV